MEPALLPDTELKLPNFYPAGSKELVVSR